MLVPYYHFAMGTTCDHKATLATMNKMKLFVMVQVFPKYLKIQKKKIPMISHLINKDLIKGTGLQDVWYHI
jgi:hypothetical protein